MRSHLRLHLPDLNLSVPALCHTSPSSSTSSLPSFSLSLSRSSSKSSSTSSVASSSTTAPLTCPPSPHNRSDPRILVSIRLAQQQ
ncbi:hypothetical protein D6D23_04970 [Aureobasidium pullulans]|nr:hypothetical protein D6D23_04970 [Aureobasidium pullulans]